MKEGFWYGKAYYASLDWIIDTDPGNYKKYEEIERSLKTQIGNNVVRIIKISSGKMVLSRY